MRGVRDGGGMASLLALALFCFFHASCPVDGLLKCYCDICADANYTCETDGYCFASTSLENDVVTYARRCYNKTNFFPDIDFSIWCTTNSLLRDQDGIQFMVACCDHSDYCNRDLRPFFPPHESRGRPYSRFANLERGTINRS